MSRQGWRVVVALVVIAGSIPTVSDLAFAALQGTTSNSTAQSFVSAKWAVGAVDTNTATPSGLNYTISAIARSTSTPGGTYFSLKNVGTVSTASLTIFETITGSAAATTVNIQSCDVNWNEATGACASGLTTISARANNVVALSIPYTVTIPPGGTKRLRIQYVKTGGAATVTAVLAIAISKSQIRTAIGTNG